MAPIEIEKMLNVLSLRKEKGYSQFELSFLMGQRDFYVRDVEDVKHTLIYTGPFSNILRQIFNCEIQTIIPDTNRKPSYSIRILEATDESGKFVYRAEKQEEGGDWEFITTFGNEPKDLLLDSPSTITEKEVKDWVMNKFNSDYFDAPKTALKIFKDCEKDLDGAIRPIHLATSLQEYTKRKKSPRLVKEKNTDSLFVFAKD
jgi:hypothetical protein